MADDSTTCPSCGAHVPAEADRCELCGTSVSETPDEESVGEEPDDSTVFCTQCGWENPPEARYCSQCGTQLQDLSDASSPGTRPVTADLPTQEETEAAASESPAEEVDDQGPMARQIAAVVGGAFVVILALFFVTQWSSQQNWSDDSSAEATERPLASGDGASSSGGGGAPMSAGQGGGGEGQLADLQTVLDQTGDTLSGSMSAEIDSLRSRVEQASGSQKRELQSELVNLLIGAGQPGRAAVIQKEVADATGAVEARRQAADLLYRWMQKLEQQGQRKLVFQVAQHAAKAYEAVANERPDDLDARTRMGEAYLLTNEPMRGIGAINKVLEEDSTFVPARFQKGLALLQINRLDQAIGEFEAVKRHAEEGSPFYQQADRAVTVIEERRGQGATGGGQSGSSAMSGQR